jgi:thiol peroxidase
VRSLDTTQIKVTAVSADLPFALKRWCDAAGVDNLVMLSDYRGAELAQSWGLLIKELRLIARAVYVLDRSGRVTYRQIVSEITHEPNYAAAIDAVQRAAG